MPARLVSQDGGLDILMDRAPVIVGRHPSCEARLDSPRISRRHCCMMPDHGQLWVRDLGSTNGIRINGQRVDSGWLKPGDELSIAHMRYRFEGEPSSATASNGHPANGHPAVPTPPPMPMLPPLPPDSVSSSGPATVDGASVDRSPLAEAVRRMLPPELAERCQIQVIVQVPAVEGGSNAVMPPAAPAAAPSGSAPSCPNPPPASSS